MKDVRNNGATRLKLCQVCSNHIRVGLICSVGTTTTNVVFSLIGAKSMIVDKP